MCYVQTARRSAFDKKLTVDSWYGYRKNRRLACLIQLHVGEEFVEFCILVFLYLDTAVSAVKSTKDQQMHFGVMM